MKNKDIEVLLAFLMGESNDSSKETEFSEIQRLDEMLTEAEIPHEMIRNFMGGFQIVYYGKNGKPVPPKGHYYGAGYGSICSVIETPFSHGNKNDTLEISGLLTEEESKKNSVAGGLSAEDVFARIKNHWEKE